MTKLKQGTYVVKAEKRVNSCYGEEYKVFFGKENNRLIVWSNKTIRDKLHEAEDGKIVDEYETFIYLSKNYLGHLNITGHGNIFSGRKTVYCKLILNTKEDNEKKIEIVMETITSLFQR